MKESEAIEEVREKAEKAAFSWYDIEIETNIIEEPSEHSHPRIHVTAEFQDDKAGETSVSVNALKEAFRIETAGDGLKAYFAFPYDK